ncbi:MAG TPA: nickel-dependent lactate racemase [Anaerolineales bacterium]|nr:nickel-dependent lactate racemase [Anaerolineae bacterium]HIP88219.1 nickel-dependent lactate racemase [Anaerolineales bacterium]
MRVKLAYGRAGLWVDLPDDAVVIEPRFVPGLPDERAALRDALRSPIGTAPLRELVRPDDTVAVVFSDLTRPMPNDRVLPPLLEELARAGVPDERIVLINGLGTHRPQTEEELTAMLGAEVVHRYRVLQHDAWDGANLVEVARNHQGRPVRVHRAYVEASVRILTGFIEPHFFAGFSGGPKAVLPGIADIDAILDNHGAGMIAHPQATWAVTEGNPIWEEMQKVAQATAPTFLLNVTLNREREITGVFAGDLAEAHRAGVSFVRRTALRPVRTLFDIVVTSNSGYPLDLNLYQAVKGMSAAAQIVRPGGHIIIAAECWDGIPDHGEYGRLLREARSPEGLLERIMSPGFRCQDQWEAQVQAQIQRKATVHVYADGLSDDQLREALVVPCRSIEETVARLRRENPSATVAVLPEGPQTVPYVLCST